MPPKKAIATASKAASAKAAGSATARKRKAGIDVEEPVAKRGRSTSATPAATKATTAKKPAVKKATNGVTKTTKTPPKKAATPKPAAKPKQQKKTPAKSRVVINQAPSKRLNIYVFGEGSNGELGLGAGKNVIDVKRPRLNPLLPAETVGVVQIAAGGMHAAALTHDNKILTWGVNDQGALGRDTEWSGGLRDVDGASDSDGDSDDSDSGLNPREATPTEVSSNSFPEGTKFVELAAGDSTTFALTDEGLVYGWGTFRSNEGILGFTYSTLVQRTPVLIPELSKITHIACGANHALALTTAGDVYAWGSGQQNQLGRRVVERTRAAGLVPREFGLPRRQIATVGCGGYHSFAVDKQGNTWAWGLNSYGECGIREQAGEDDAVVPKPTKVSSLAGKDVTLIKGGAHHSLAVTSGGQCLVWGRADGAQCGIKITSLPPSDLIFDERGKPRILTAPTAVDLSGKKCVYATCESDHAIAIDEAGRAWSWGFGATYQTGQGTDEEIEVATVIDNTAVRGKKLCWAGAGGQFSVLAGEADAHMANGI